MKILTFIPFLLAPALQGQVAPAPPAATRAARAEGTFEVKVRPLSGDNAEWGAFGRLSLDKTFHGALEGTSLGQMLAEGDGKGASGGYVALERVTGALGGLKGTFVLQHSGILRNRVPGMTITVVPGSGTGDLKGLEGALRILMADGKHSYEFDYTLPAR